MRTHKHQQGVCNIDKKENNSSVSRSEKFAGRSMVKYQLMNELLA